MTQWLTTHIFFISMVKFIPRYFILCSAVINWIIFLFSLSDSSLLVYRNAKDFCILILYPVTLLNLLISSNSFFVESLWFYLYSIMSSTNSDSFTTSFPVWIPFILFSCLIVVVRTSNTVLNEGGKSRHFCLVPDLTGKAFSFSLLSIMFAMHLSYIVFTMLR